MGLSRQISMGVLSGVATAWAAALVVGGLWLMRDAPALWPVLGTIAPVGGVCAIASGQFVFMVLVADRVFPDAGRRTMWWAEVLMVVCMACSAGIGLLTLGVRG